MPTREEETLMHPVGPSLSRGLLEARARGEEEAVYWYKRQHIHPRKGI